MHPTLSAAVADEQRRDLIRAARLSRATRRPADPALLLTAAH